MKSLQFALVLASCATIDSMRSRWPSWKMHAANARRWNGTGTVPTHKSTGFVAGGTNGSMVQANRSSLQAGFQWDAFLEAHLKNQSAARQPHSLQDTRQDRVEKHNAVNNMLWSQVTAMLHFSLEVVSSIWRPLLICFMLLFMIRTMPASIMPACCSTKCDAQDQEKSEDCDAIPTSFCADVTCCNEEDAAFLRCATLDVLHVLDVDLEVLHISFDILEQHVANKSSEATAWRKSNCALLEEEAGLYLCIMESGSQAKLELVSWSANSSRSLEVRVLPEVHLEHLDQTESTESRSDLTTMYSFLVYIQEESSAKCLVLGSSDGEVCGKWMDNLCMYSTLSKRLTSAGSLPVDMEPAPSPSRWARTLSALFGKHQAQCGSKPEWQTLDC